MKKKSEIKKIEKEFLMYVKKMKHIEEASALLYWDLRTKAPKKGAPYRAETIGALSTLAQKKLLSKKMKKYLTILGDKENASIVRPLTKVMVSDLKKDYKLYKKIPIEEYEAYTILASNAETIWEEAKAKQDFTILQPYLEQLVTYKKRFLQYWGKKGHPYDALLDLYEPGMTVKVLDRIFDQVKKEIVPLVKEIQESGNRLDTSWLQTVVSKECQISLSEQALQVMEYDFEAGRLDETEHPFETSIHPYDVRITNRYDEKDFTVSLFGVMHEGGHALYEQNLSDHLIGTTLYDGASMGIHESQSLFFENFIGRSEAFWEFFLPVVKQEVKELENVTLKQMYQAVNAAKPSLIRIEADELTYVLHIIIRYELEKRLFNDELEVKDLPKAWNELYEQYLGISPSHDGEGVLQDVHWAGGDFGYFPSYALGYMYAAQLRHAMEKQLSIDAMVSEGNMKSVVQWLSERVHQYAKTKKPLDLLMDATGEPLNVSYYTNYLKTKYTRIYLS